ncbi:hypothetical protein [Bosea sp. LjRoot237]|uniref:hypothetical protein n=1 Tax=Bosea sp. LjRoot237 TaxID=3342292 RepID=UPI003ECDC916
MREFMIGDQVETFINGPIVGYRVDERGEMFKVEYEDVEGVACQRWFYETELYHNDDYDDESGCCEQAHLARANASLN